MKQYKVIPGPKNVCVDRNHPETAFNLFADLINSNVSDGWEYYSMETITVTESGGCMQAPVPTNYYMLIFVKEV